MKALTMFRKQSGHSLKPRLGLVLLGGLCAISLASRAQQSGSGTKPLSESHAAVKNSTKAHPIGAPNDPVATGSASHHNPAEAETNRPVSNDKTAVDNTHQGHPVGTSDTSNK